MKKITRLLALALLVSLAAALTGCGGTPAGAPAETPAVEEAAAAVRDPSEQMEQTEQTDAAWFALTPENAERFFDPQTGDRMLVSRQAEADGRQLTVMAIGRQRDGYEQYGARALLVYDGDSLVQTILLREALERDGLSGVLGPGYTEAWSPEATFAVEDLNFDGNDDLMVAGWIPNNTIPYYCYLWSGERGQYEYAFSLPGISVDAEKQELISEYHTSDGGYEYRYDRYRYDEEGNLVLVER